MTDELSDEMKEAIRILRSDGRAAAFRDMEKSNRDLIARMDKRDQDDAARQATRKEEESKATGGQPPNSDANLGNQGDGKEGSGEGAPPPPVIDPPKEDEKPKRRSAWWGELDDD